MFWRGLAVLLLVVLALWLWRPQPPLPLQGGLPELRPLPQAKGIRVYFNQERDRRFVDERGVERYGEDLEKRLLTELQLARHSIDLAIHELDRPAIALALASAQRRGVRVRVILEARYRHSFATLARPERLGTRERETYQRWRNAVDSDGDGQIRFEELQWRDVATILEQAEVPLLDDTADGSRGSATMHHKFAVIDGERVVTGSANFTASDLFGDAADPRTVGNANHLLVIESAALAALFSEEFALMWGDGPGGLPDSRFGAAKPPRAPQQVRVGEALVTVRFGPTAEGPGINSLIADTLQQARHSVEMALFVFSAAEIGEALGQVAAGGVAVRGALDPGFAYREYAVERRCGIVFGTPALVRGDKLHHKFAIIDGHTVLTGSHNWSAAADRRNDEVILRIESPTVAAHFSREFARLWRGIRSDRQAAQCHS